MSDLHWSKRGDVACEMHLPPRDSPRWTAEGWQPVAGTTTRTQFQCAQCKGSPVRHSGAGTNGRVTSVAGRVSAEGLDPGTPDPRGASRPARLAPRTAVVCWRFASGRTLRAVECALRHDNAHIDVTLRYGGDTVARTERVPDLATALAVAERWRQTVSATPGFTEVTLPPGERVSTAE